MGGWSYSLDDSDKRFSSLTVCATGLERQDRDLVRTSVESGGGEYSGVLDQVLYSDWTIIIFSLI